MPDDEELELIVDGKAHTRWQTVTIRLGLEELASSFEVSFTDRGAEKGEPFGIREGDAVTLRLAGEQVLTGYVDDFECSDDIQGRKLSVSGRSRTADLVDCSALLRPLTEQTPLEIAKRLCEPFDIDVEVTDERIGIDPVFAKPVPLFGVEPGETVFDALTRLMRGRGVLVTANAKGDLELARAGVSRVQQTVLRYGDNLKQRTYRGSHRDRFSQYRMRGQTQGNDRWNKRSASTMIATVDDDGIERYRPLLIVADEADSFEALGQRGVWERNTRSARGQRYSGTVRGWAHATQRTGGLAAVDTSLGLRAVGRTWRPNATVRVVDDPLGIDQYMLVTGVTFQRALEAGKLTALELAPPEGYAPLTAPPKLVKLTRRRPKTKDRVRL